MPTHGIKDYLENLIRPERLMSDEQMVGFLEAELQKGKLDKVQPLNPI